MPRINLHPKKLIKGDQENVFTFVLMGHIYTKYIHNFWVSHHCYNLYSTVCTNTIAISIPRLEWPWKGLFISLNDEIRHSSDFLCTFVPICFQYATQLLLLGSQSVIACRCWVCQETFQTIWNRKVDWKLHNDGIQHQTTNFEFDPFSSSSPRPQKIY